MGTGILLAGTEGLAAIPLGGAFTESVVTAGYGIAEITAGFMGTEMPSSTELLTEILSFGGSDD